MNWLSKKIIFLIISFCFLAPFIIRAITIENPLGEDVTFEAVIEKITNWILAAAIVIAPIMFAMAAFYFITSAGSQEKIKKARQIFFYTLIGLFLALLAKGLVAMVKNLLGVS